MKTVDSYSLLNEQYKNLKYVSSVKFYNKIKSKWMNSI